jgi:RNA polymerase sigma-70 factor (ECF subfamily)
MEQDQEAEIVARIRKGEREAFSQLVEEYKAPIFNLAYRMTGNWEDAAELAQETFVRAFAKLNKFKLEQRFFTWLYAISLNVVKNHLRRRSLWGKLVAGGVSAAIHDQGSNQEKDLLAKEEQQQLQDALLKLPPDQRAALVLRYYEDQSFADIAQICGLPENTIKMRVYRALEKLRAVMMGEQSNH